MKNTGIDGKIIYKYGIFRHGQILGTWEIFRIQQMEVRKRTIFLAIWIVGICPEI